LSVPKDTTWISTVILDFLKEKANIFEDKKVLHKWIFTNSKVKQKSFDGECSIPKRIKKNFCTN
jgi:hypothetical protein